jgi:tRNA G18 (ribose-2'-O)-methylase SpoU
LVQAFTALITKETRMHPNAIEKTVSFNVVDSLQDLPLDQIKQVAVSRQLPFSIAIANITGDLNTGMLIRTAAIFGANKVYIFGRRKYDRRSTVGAHHYVDIEYYPDDTEDFDWGNMLQIIRVNGYTPVLIEQGGPNITTMELPITPPCLVFGPEGSGIPIAITESEICYSINQIGVLRSLNVAVAAGIAMHQVVTLF